MRTLYDEDYENDEGREPVTQEYDELVYFKEKSILIREGRTKYWIPRSQIEEDFTDEDLEEMKNNKEPGSFTIPRWLYDDKTEAEDRKPSGKRLHSGSQQ